MDDFEIALQLQRELNEEPSVHEDLRTDIKPMSLVDNRWELLDPNPDARSLFLEFDNTFFSGKLSGVEVRWSPRMTSCAGICCYEGRGGLCSIRLSKPLLTLRPRKDLIETLLHEMIHAYLFVTNNDRDRDGHGPEFHKHMNRINREAGTNITVYHSFTDEVEHYLQHWWKCDGPCQKQHPYYGIYKRAINSPPSKANYWWDSHQRNCCGTFQKIKEPDGFGQKKSKPTDKSEIPNGCKDIRKAFGTVSKLSDDLDKFEDGESTYDNTNTSAKRCPTSLFPGTGKTIGEPVIIDNERQTIVRKLPGIGIITSERPSDTASRDNNQSDKTHQDNWDDDIILYSPTKEVLSKAIKDQRTRNRGSNENREQEKSGANDNEHNSSVNSTIYDNRKRTQSTVLDSDSEQEFDHLLQNIRKKRRLSNKLNNKLSRSQLKAMAQSPVGSCQKITNFMSVSNPLSPDYLKDTYKDKSPTSHYTRGGVVKEFASNRNRRAHDLMTSDSEDDELVASNGRRSNNRHKSKPTATVSTAPDSSDDNIFDAARDEIDLTGLESDYFSGSHTEINPIRTATQHHVKVNCPVCQVTMPASSINDHLDQCLG